VASRKPKKNRSSRERKLARSRAAHDARGAEGRQSAVLVGSVPEQRVEAPFDDFEEERPLLDDAGPRVDLRFGGFDLPATRVAFGDAFPSARERAIRQGWGFDIEVPAVLDLLDAVDQGKVTAERARQGLLAAVEALYGPYRCLEFEAKEDRAAWCERDGGCRICDECRSAFEHLLKESGERWHRFQRPDEFPFTVSKHGLHVTTCSVVNREMPREFAPPEGDAYTQALRTYAHTVNPYGDDFEGERAYPRFEPLTAAQARAWVASRTGPKGGRNFKRCQRCAPTP